jgi:hypothetical protein
MNIMGDESDAVVPSRKGRAEKLAVFLKESRTDRRLRPSGKKIASGDRAYRILSCSLAHGWS